MIDERKRPPVKKFVLLMAYGSFPKGAIIQPTGVYRDQLLRRGIIQEIKDEPPVPSPVLVQNRMEAPQQRREVLGLPHKARR